MRAKKYLVPAAFLAGALAVVSLTAAGKFLANPPQANAAADKEPPKAADKRDADREAIRQTSADFTKALEKGDAKALAFFWTEEGEYVAGDGTTLHGRAAVEESYAKFFKDNPNLQLDVVPESLRFLSRDSAVEEGYAKLTKGKAGEPTSSRYSTLYVRENGKWLVAVLREWPDEGIILRDLDWLIGTWAAKAPDGDEVRTAYEWDEDKAFIRMRLTIKGKDRNISGTQMIGKDPRTGDLHSWIFESEGGFGEAAWTWDGKRWLQHATGVLPDGGEMTATNILTPIDKDSFTWQSIERTVNGDAQPNVPPVKVARVK
jgi:uncharacterized protein (TIGR02246 family)